MKPLAHTALQDSLPFIPEAPCSSWNPELVLPSHVSVRSCHLTEVHPEAPESAWDCNFRHVVLAPRSPSSQVSQLPALGSACRWTNYGLAPFLKTGPSLASGNCGADLLEGLHLGLGKEATCGLRWRRQRRTLQRRGHGKHEEARNPKHTGRTKLGVCEPEEWQGPWQAGLGRW